MKTHVVVMASLLIGTMPALAQPGQGPGHGDRPQRPPVGGPGGGPGGGARPDRPTPLPGPGRPGTGRPNPGRPIPLPGPGAGRPDPGRPGRPGIRPPVHRPGTGRPPNFRPIHGPAFRYPRGYAYRRWTIGLLLPSLFLGANYIWSNYGAMGVEPPPPGHAWVRYGPDLLLVDRRTRRVVDVIRGAFY